MNPLPPPSRTPMATYWLQHDASSDRVKRALLSSIDGHRNVIELGALRGRWACRPMRWSACAAKA